MNKIGLLVACILASSSVLISQGHHDPEVMERIESRKVAFLSDKLNLSPEEAQVFWPVHNAYQDEMRSLRKDRDQREAFMRGELDGDKALDKMFDREEKELELRKKYAMRLKEILGARQTMFYFHLDRQFKEEMLRELRRRHDEGPGLRKNR